MRRPLRGFLAVLLPAVLLTPVASAVDATPASAPFYPTTVNAVLANPSDSSTTTVQVSWSGQSANGSPITGFQAYAYSGTGWTTQASVSCSASGSQSSCNISGLAFATSYRFKVTVTNAAGSSTSDLSTDIVTTPSRAQTVTISGEPSSYVFGNPDFQLSATATSGLAVTWSIPTTTSICQVDLSGSVHFIAAGDCVVRATQDGSGSAYGSAYDETTITATTNLSATIASATSVQSVQATLNGLVPFAGKETTPTFCVSRTNNVTASCNLPSGVTISSYTPSTITLTSGSNVSAVVSGLDQSTTYYFWLTVTATGATPYSTGTSSFTTTVGPSIGFTGSTSGTVGVAMTGTLTATSGSGVYSAWSANSYPPGLTFEPGVTATTSIISGTPSAAGTFAALFTVTDTSGIDATVTVTYSIAAAPVAPEENSNPGDSGSTATIVNTPEKKEEVAAKPRKAANDADEKSVPDNNSSLELRVGNTKQELTVSPTGTGTGLNLSSGIGGFNIEVESDQPLYQSQSGGPARVAIKTGNQASLKGEVFAPESQIDFYIYSKPTWIGGSFADKAGQFVEKVVISRTIPLGFHTIQLVGISPQNSRVVVNIPVVILPADGRLEAINDKIIARTISKPVATSILIKDIPKSARLVWPKNSAPTIKGIKNVKLGKRLVQIYPQSEFSGIALFTLQIKTKNLSVERMISLTVLPTTPTSGSYAPTSSKETKISWKKATGAVSYRVLRNGVQICSTSNLTCSVKNLIGPASKITINSVGNDGTESKSLRAKYINPKYILLAMVNFDDNSAELNLTASAKLQEFMKIFKAEGFDSVQIFGFADSSGPSSRNQALSGARALSVANFLSGKVEGFVDSIGQGVSKPIKSNATKEGRAANRRVEIYVN